MMAVVIVRSTDELLEWSTDLAPVNDRMQIGGGTQAGHEALIGDTLQAPAYHPIYGLSNILTIAFSRP